MTIVTQSKRQQKIDNRSDEYRNIAFHLYENGDYGLAICIIKNAIGEIKKDPLALL